MNLWIESQNWTALKYGLWDDDDDDEEENENNKHRFFFEQTKNHVVLFNLYVRMSLMKFNHYTRIVATAQ